eukprot:SAG31_NODE_1703_length_7495_cov_3.115062_10_plen_111_part_00
MGGHSSLTSRAAPLPCGFGATLTADDLASFGIGAWSGDDLGPTAASLRELWAAMVEAKGLLVLKDQLELRRSPAAYMNFSNRLLRVAAGGPSQSIPINPNQYQLTPINPN